MADMQFHGREGPGGIAVAVVAVSGPVSRPRRPGA